MKIFLVLATLTLLASCTQPQTPVTPVPKAEMQKEDTMMKENMKMEADKKMKEESMKVDTMKKEMMMKDMSGTMMDSSGSDMMKDEPKMMKATGYMNYDESKVNEALASGQKVVLFFHAAWCPSCRALDSAINSSLSSIPADALIVKVDYDTSDAMKKKYGVTYQHTTVLIDKDMNLVSKKSGAKTVGDILN